MIHDEMNDFLVRSGLAPVNSSSRAAFSVQIGSIRNHTLSCEHFHERSLLIWTYTLPLAAYENSRIIRLLYGNSMASSSDCNELKYSVFWKGECLVVTSCQTDKVSSHDIEEYFRSLIGLAGSRFAPNESGM